MAFEQTFQISLMIFVLFVLRFYGPSADFKSFRVLSVNLIVLNNVLVVHDYLA